MNKTYFLKDISVIAKEIISSVSSKTLLFYGEMGTGKTTLIKEIVKQLGVKDVAHSPTFSLVNEYLSRKGETIYHFDFYRIEQEEEAYDIGIEEYFYENNWCLIEWPEKVENLLPLESVIIMLKMNPDNSRTIQIK
ncbi:MAG: tRNA (adenosine(37)-N6)-threonylcarbamoyltransferase complex ATPase subunit type 1 TsaE [Flavobacteriaceae bacterium]|nr:tRNA (adenosine(37)-N6)-threonylcarbamoyltransferase complex ATPase subunit type 1 TsaE [Flavobacteriaceae bacterium]